MDYGIYLRLDLLVFIILVKGKTVLISLNECVLSVCMMVCVQDVRMRVCVCAYGLCVCVYGRVCVDVCVCMCMCGISV